MIYKGKKGISNKIKKKAIHKFREKIKNTNTISKSDILELERILGSNAFTASININTFTNIPSSVNVDKIINILDKVEQSINTEYISNFQELIELGMDTIEHITKLEKIVSNDYFIKNEDFLNKYNNMSKRYTYEGPNGTEVSTPIDIATTIPILEMIFKRTDYMSYLFNNNLIKIREHILEKNSDNIDITETTEYKLGIITVLNLLSKNLLTLDLNNIPTKDTSVLISITTLDTIISIYSNKNIKYKLKDTKLLITDMINNSVKYTEDILDDKIVMLSNYLSIIDNPIAISILESFSDIND